MGEGISLVQEGGCQNYSPDLGTLNIRCRIIVGIQKGTIILTTTQEGIIKGLSTCTKEKNLILVI